MYNEIKLLIFKEYIEDKAVFAGQCIEKDICAQADTVNEVLERFELTYKAEMLIGYFDKIDPAPEMFKNRYNNIKSDPKTKVFGHNNNVYRINYKIEG